MTTYFTLAWRNIWRNKRRTLITVSAIMFAVVLSIFMQSINRGSHEMMIDNMTRFNTGHVQIQDYRYNDEPSLDNAFAYDEKLRSKITSAAPRIEMALPRIQTFMLAADPEVTRGTLVTGIDLEKEDRFNNIKSHKTAGRFFEEEERAAVIAEGLSDRVGLGVGDTLALVGQGRFGMSASGLFEIVGIIEHPIPDMNNQAVYLPLTTAADLLSAEGHITNLLIALESERYTEQVANKLREFLEDSELVVFTWPELIPELLELLEFDLAGAYMMSFILYVVIAFGFLGMILTMTLERIREFGILISVGMQRIRLAFTLFLEVLIISIIGVLGGSGVAWLILYYFYLNPIQLTGEAAEAIKDMGWQPVLPMSFAPDQFYTQGIIVFFIAILIALYPVIRVFRLNVIEASRY